MAAAGPVAACGSPGSDDGASSKGQSSPALPPGLPQLPVVLRVEIATKGQARFLTWSVVVLNLFFILTALGLVLLREQDLTVGQLQPYYTVELAAGCLCLSLDLLMLAWLGWSVRRTKKERRLWSVRQRYFVRTAAVVLCLQAWYTASFVASFAALKAQPDCRYPWQVLNVFDFLQYAACVSTLMFLLSRLQAMCVWRGPGALNMPPDFRLLCDRPAREQARYKAVLIIIWALILLLFLAKMIDRIVRASARGVSNFNGGCDVLLQTWDCEASPLHRATAVITFTILCVYILCWYLIMRRALRDQEMMPYCRYRSTLIFIRVQQRVIIPVLTAVICSIGALTVAPAFVEDSCWGFIDSQMANLPVYLSLTLAAIVLAFLYMPRTAVDSPLLQELLQDWCWTQAAMPADIERRCQRLLALEGAGGGTTGSTTAGGTAAAAANGTGSGGTTGANASPRPLTNVVHGLARLAGFQDLNDAREQLRREPMFCMETALKLFFWSRLAYREHDALTYPWVNAHIALPLFGLSQFETVWDDGTDTHACIGYSSTQAVVAFRGTQTLQNVITDLQTWQVALPGHSRHRGGRPLRVHAGFLGAWLHNGFNQKVLTRLREIDSGPTPLRFWVTGHSLGHSLGGALASLAALSIQEEHPGSQVTCYVYGCPRVGNPAFASKLNKAVPDTWSIVNGLDPIPWVPKWGYKSVGNRVTINPRGDLILRPSYFEMSVTHRGSSVKHHSTRGGAGYAVSLAAVLKAQFAANKALPGGAEGVQALAAAVDIGACLVLTHMDLESLSNPELLPELQELLAQQQLRAKRQGDSQRWGAGEGCVASCRCWPMGANEEGQPGGDSVGEEGAPDVEGGQAGVGGVPGAAVESMEQRRRWRAAQVLTLTFRSLAGAAAAPAAGAASTAAEAAAAAVEGAVAAAAAAAAAVAAARAAAVSVAAAAQEAPPESTAAAAAPPPHEAASTTAAAEAETAPPESLATAAAEAASPESTAAAAAAPAASAAPPETSAAAAAQAFSPELASLSSTRIRCQY